jgi:hypothetical protein
MAKVFVDVGLEAILNNTNCMAEGKVKNKRQLPSCSNYPEYIGDDASVSSSASYPFKRSVRGIMPHRTFSQDPQKGLLNTQSLI